MRTALISIVCVIPLAAHGADLFGYNEIAISKGRSHDAADIYRIGLKRPFSKVRRYSENRWITGYYEASTGYWQNMDVDVYVVAFAPALTYNFGPEDGTHFYVEGGVGISRVSELGWGRREFSSHTLFEDRMGLGVRTASVDMNLRYMHYSNAGLVPPNDGIDIILFTVSFVF